MTRIEYWTVLRSLKTEWSRQKTGNDFDNYVLEKTGIVICYTEGHISSEYKIANKEQYLMFTLRWS
jgi:hypothetical protein